MSFGVTKASSGKRDGGGLRQHIEPMGVKLRLIGEQVSFPDSFEKSRRPQCSPTPAYLIPAAVRG